MAHGAIVLLHDRASKDDLDELILAESEGSRLVHMRSRAELRSLKGSDESDAVDC